MPYFTRHRGGARVSQSPQWRDNRPMAQKYELVVRAASALIDGRFRSAELGIDAGLITCISDSPLEGDRVIMLADDEVLIPGIVDTHVHVNEPGRTEWEGFASATRAASPPDRVAGRALPSRPTPSRSNWA